MPPIQIGSCLDVIIVYTSIYFGKCQLLVHAELRETYPISKSMTHSVYKIVNSDCIIVSKFSAFKRNVGTSHSFRQESTQLTTTQPTTNIQLELETTDSTAPSTHTHTSIHIFQNKPAFDIYV